MSSETDPNEEHPRRLELTTLMTPDTANFSGKVHGGVLLKLLDEVAYSCAARYSGHYVVTLMLDDAIFLAPVHVGELVTFKACVNWVGRTSMEIGIRVLAENHRTRLDRHVMSCFFVMIAMDEAGNKCEVPAFEPRGDEEARRSPSGPRRAHARARSRPRMMGPMLRWPTPLLLFVACTKTASPDADAGSSPPATTASAPAQATAAARDDPGPPAGEGGADELHALEGRGEAELVAELGAPDREHEFVMRDCCTEFQIELYNTYPPGVAEHAEVPIREWTWQYDGYALTVWLHRLGDVWTVLETSRYSDDTEF